MAILLQPRDTFHGDYKSSLQAHQYTWEHFTPTLALSVVKHTHSTPTISSASCEPSPSPYTDFASSWPPPIPLALGCRCLSNNVPSHIGAYNRGTACLPSSAWALSLPLPNSTFCRTTAASPQQQLIQSYSRLFSPVAPEPSTLIKRWSSQL
jgi:hypothetical protein